MTINIFKIYTDNCLVVSQHPDDALKKLCKYFSMTSESVELTKLYLGGKWLIQQALNNLECILGKHRLKLCTNIIFPLPCNYRSECVEYTPDNEKLCSFLIGFLKWLVGLGQIIETWSNYLQNSKCIIPFCERKG